jgi:imidazolonepropionase-like amidohydrolase
MSMQATTLVCLFALATATAAAAQDGRPVAFTNARLVTVSGATIERGTLVVKNGKVEAIGADAVVPAGARVIDATGKTILPGLVSAWSRAGLNAPPPRGEERERLRLNRIAAPARILR